MIWERRSSLCIARHILLAFSTIGVGRSSQPWHGPGEKTMVIFCIFITREMWKSEATGSDGLHWVLEMHCLPNSQRKRMRSNAPPSAERWGLLAHSGFFSALDAAGAPKGWVTWCMLRVFAVCLGDQNTTFPWMGPLESVDWLYCLH